MILCSLTPCVWGAVANYLKNSKLQKLESKIDSLVYKLHNLTDDEIATIQRANPPSLRADNGDTAKQAQRSFFRKQDEAASFFRKQAQRVL